MPDPTQIDGRVVQIFAFVSEALAGATHALLAGESSLGQQIVDGDRAIDNLTNETITLAWDQIDAGGTGVDELRHLVSVLLILPELERSADLAEHIASQAVRGVGIEMSPISRGIVQRMSDVALEMWSVVADAYADRSAQGIALDEADDEIDILRRRLTSEIATESMPLQIAMELTLLARYYERLGDHAVNLARRIDKFSR